MSARRWKGMIAASAVAALLGCASDPKATNARPERNFNAPSLTVDASSHARQVLDGIPLESLMDRFETYDTTGRLITYMAFTDTEAGALVFVDGKLLGSLSRLDAQAFYVCRGHMMTTPNRYWASEAGEWVESLLANVRPETSVVLEFTGKSAVQSIKTVTDNPLLGRIKSIIGMGTNPLGVINTLNNARSDFEASEQFDAEARGMSQLKPGMSEARLAGVAKPQDLAFVNGGMVLSYPAHRIEYFVVDGSIRVIQQPSFHFLARTNAALFYAPGAQWTECTAQHWSKALPRADAKEPGNKVAAAEPQKG